MSKYNNSKDIVYGTVVSGRPSELENVHNMVGMFINTIPQRITFEVGQTFKSLLIQVQQNFISTEPYHYMSLAEIQQLSGIGANLIQNILTFENYPIPENHYDIAIDENEYIVDESSIIVFERTNYDLETCFELK